MTKAKSEWEPYCCHKCGKAKPLQSNESCEFCNSTYTLTCEKCGEAVVLNEKMLCEKCFILKGDANDQG